MGEAQEWDLRMLGLVDGAGAEPGTSCCRGGGRKAAREDRAELFIRETLVMWKGSANISCKGLNTVSLAGHMVSDKNP